LRSAPTTRSGAVKFYKAVFGWEIDKWGGPQDYWVVTTGPQSELGINGAITRRMGNLSVVNIVEWPP